MADKDSTPVFDPEKLERVEVATDYPMEPDEFDKLFNHNCYCEMAHVNRKGYPIVTPMFYVIIDGFLYMSSIQKYRKKVHDLEANPKISVSVHNDGSNANRQKAILLMAETFWSKVPDEFVELIESIDDLAPSPSEPFSGRRAAVGKADTRKRCRGGRHRLQDPGQKCPRGRRRIHGPRRSRRASPWEA